MQVRRSLITTGLTVAVTAAVTATLTTSVGASATPAALPAAAAPAAAGRAGGAPPDPTTATLRQLARHTKLRIGTAVDTTRWRTTPRIGAWSPSSSRRSPPRTS